MTTYTTDFLIAAEDGWTLVATNPSQLLIKPAIYHPWWVAITDSGAPAATVVGVPMGRDPSDRNQEYFLPNGVTGLVYVKIKVPTDSQGNEKMAFNVTATTGTGSGGSGTAGATVTNPLFATQPNVIAAGTVNTRPANTTAYAANDSVSNNATAGSVTALPVTISDTADQPVIIEEILVDSTDTGPGTASATIRIHVFRSDPTASSGVVGGDNAAWSNKAAGWVGSFSGTMVLFSDGSRGKLAPDAGTVLISNTGTGVKTLWYQIQTLTAFTPSANSTTFQATFKGWQGRLTS